MVRGLYTGWTGMFNEQNRLDIISNNLANASTVGFKKDGVTNQAFKDVLTIKAKDESENWRSKEIGDMNLGVKIGEIYTDYTQGSLRETGNPYDLAIGGEGFFQMAVRDSSGKETLRYTRAGQFTVTQDGYIVDVNGNNLMGEGGYLQIPIDADQVVIDEGGYVYADEQLVDKVIIKDFENYDYLAKASSTMYEAVPGATEKESSAGVYQGFTEQSNVNVVSEMVNMISITRAYEANQKVIKAVDSSLQQAASTGKIS